jgi:predicted ATP-dependent endonuclease of OLD family
MSAIAFDEDSLQAIKLSLNSHLSDSNLNSKDLSQKLLEITLELLKEYFPTKEQNKYEDYLDNMCQLQNLVSLIEIENIRKTSKIESFVVNLKNSKSEELVVLLECLRNNNKASCSWLGVSSGHIAYLNLFSSIYKELYRSRNDVILCIDEGDLYLHPQWQIEFFDKLLSVLPNLSSGKVQLILTSHSPFLLSDLPNQSITVLTSDASGVAMSGSDIEQKTFGANLYELYSNLFFLNKSRTGVFANNKIKKLLEQIESTDTDTDISQKDIKIFSEMIGDKVIKNILDKGINND